MKSILDEMLGEGATTLTKEKLLQLLDEFDKRLSKLEEDTEVGGVYVDGSPQIVKDYLRDLEEKKRSTGGGK